MRRTLLASLSALIFATAVCAQRPAHEVEVLLRALDERGQPIDGAGVAVGEWPTTDDALQRPIATSGQDGQLRWRVTIPAGVTRGTLLLAAPGRACFRMRLWQTPFAMPAHTQPSVDLGDVRLPRGHTMTGRVRDEQGRPIAGARVSAADHLAPSPEFEAFASHALSDERGVFVMRGATGRAMSLRVQADGYHRSELHGVHPGAPLDMALEPSGSLSGEVRHADGRTFVGYAMRLGEYFEWGDAVTPITDGTFRLPLETRGRGRVTVYSEALQVVGQSQLIDGPADDVVIDVVAQDDTSSFSVRAVDADGEAVRDLRASALWMGRELDPWMVELLRHGMHRADDEGAVRLTPGELERGDATLVVLAAGYAPHVAFLNDYAPGKEYVAKLTRGAVVAGRLVDAATGAPMGGVEVAVTKVGKEGAHWPAKTITDTDGAFRIADLPNGRCRVVARHPDGTVEAKQVVKLEAGETTDSVSLEMPVGAAVRGRLRGDLPAATDWRVTLAPADAGPTSALAAFGAEEEVPPTARIVDGAFTLPRRARGESTLFLIAPVPPRCGAPLWIPLTKVVVAGEDLELDLPLRPHLPAHVHGKVLARGAEAPMDRLVVVARADGEDAEVHNWTLVEPDGTYELMLAPGAYELIVVDSVSGVVLLPPGETIDLSPAARRRADLVVPLATLHVKFDTTSPSVPVQSLHVRRRRAEEALFLPFGEERYGEPGATLAGTNRAVTLFVPPGPHQLLVQQGCDSITLGMLSQSSGEQPIAEVDLAEGEELTEVLVTPEPQPIDAP